MAGPQTFMEHLDKKLDGNYIKILHAVLNKYWKQHPIKQKLYGHLRGSLDKFPNFFRMGTFIDSTHMKL